MAVQRRNVSLKEMHLYLDIDGVLLDYKADAPAEHAVEFIDYILEEFDCYWLTTHCQGDTSEVNEYLSEYFPEDIVRRLAAVKPTTWKTLKTEGIDFTTPFVWIDDYPFLVTLKVTGKVTRKSIRCDRMRCNGVQVRKITPRVN